MILSCRSLLERGAAHEQSYVEHLTRAGLAVTRIGGVEVTNGAATETLVAMQRGVPVIVQGALSNQGWSGRADILRRVEVPSALGDWSYESIDAKLARETKAAHDSPAMSLFRPADRGTGVGARIYVCCRALVGVRAAAVPVCRLRRVFPKGEARPCEAAMAEAPRQDNYPDPIEHCDICRWARVCDKRRRDDDHLCLVAGISKIQINELKATASRRYKVWAACCCRSIGSPIAVRPLLYPHPRAGADCGRGPRGGVGNSSCCRCKPASGLPAFPTRPTATFFLTSKVIPLLASTASNICSAIVFKDAHGALVYEGELGLSRADEKRAFETFVDFVMARWAQFPEMHIYHYAPYEPAALKRLMGRYATREEEIDRMLRAGLFVDLYHVVRHGIRASVESYSIKQLEPFYGFRARNAARRCECRPRQSPGQS